MNRYYLIDWTFNYADEFDVVSYEILTYGELANLRNNLKKLDQDKETELYFGTNEAVHFTPKDLIAKLDAAVEIGYDECMAFKNMFGYYIVGMNIYSDRIQEIYNYFEDEDNN